MADAVPAVGVMVEGANALRMFVAFKDCLRQDAFHHSITRPQWVVSLPSAGTERSRTQRRHSRKAASGRMIEKTRQHLPLR
jgi:hypothetical protein